MIVHLGIGAMPLERIARHTKARVSASVPKELCPRRLVTNSAQILPGDIFCALRGRKDGHDYIEDALSRGASAVLCENETTSALPTLTVKSTVSALGDWARASLTEHEIRVIAITGSVGKTTVKNTLSALLSAHAPTHATEGNQNNALGVPFTVLSSPASTRFLIAECGTDHPGEIAYLSHILSPDIAIVTCIGHAHIGAFGSREAIAEEKLSVTRYMKQDGTLFVPFGEPLTASLSPSPTSRIFVKLPTEKEKEEWGIADTDLPSLWALAYAKAIARHLKIPFDGREKALREASHSRSSSALEKGVLWIDDSYNASPESVYAAIMSLSTHTGRRIAVLGDMLELGDRAPAMHRAMGKLAALHASISFFFGAHAQDYADGAKAAGAVGHAGAGRYFQVLKGTAEEMAQAVLPHLKEGDAVLVKASRALRAEEFLYQLKEMYIP